MKKRLILSVALLVMAGCKGGVPQVDQVPTAPTTGPVNSAVELKYLCMYARGQGADAGDCARTKLGSFFSGLSTCTYQRNACAENNGIRFNVWNFSPGGLIIRYPEFEFGPAPAI
jgi:hypothetical protein